MILPQPSQGFCWTQEPWGAALRSAALAEVAPHLFTSAAVSVSRDGSDPALAAVTASLGLTADAIVQAHQVHGREVLVVKRGTVTLFAGSGVRHRNGRISRPDPVDGARHHQLVAAVHLVRRRDRLRGQSQ